MTELIITILLVPVATYFGVRVALWHDDRKTLEVQNRAFKKLGIDVFKPPTQKRQCTICVYNQGELHCHNCGKARHH